MQTDFKPNVRRYLKDNYDAVEADIDAALGTDATRTILADAERMGSYPYYAGDKIAEIQGWAAIPEADLAEGAYDGTPEDDDDLLDEQDTSY